VYSSYVSRVTLMSTSEVLSNTSILDTQVDQSDTKVLFNLRTEYAVFHLDVASSEGVVSHVHLLCTSIGTLPASIPPTIVLLHQHIEHNMSGIEDHKQLSLRTGQLPNNALGINAPPSPALKSAPADSSVHYTCFIRLPFCRGDFVDPPQVSCIRPRRV
jgi:hypothetical protein